MPELSVILPAYLEEENLRLLLPRLKKVLQDIDAEVLVVDTQEPLDATAEAAAEAGARYLNRTGGNAYGDAVRTGIEAARGTWILFMDADGSHTPEFIPKLWSRRDGHDVVMASRYVEGGHQENPWHLVLMSRVLNWTYALVLGLPLQDVSNSFKLYRRTLLEGIELRSDNFDVVEELVYLASRQRTGVRMLEVPYTFKRRMFGDTKRSLILFIATYAWTMLRLRIRR